MNQALRVLGSMVVEDVCRLQRCQGQVAMNLPIRDLAVIEPDGNAGPEVEGIPHRDSGSLELALQPVDMAGIVRHVGDIGMWGSRTRPPALTWAFRRLVRIR